MDIQDVEENDIVMDEMVSESIKEDVIIEEKSDDNIKYYCERCAGNAVVETDGKIACRTCGNTDLQKI